MSESSISAAPGVHPRAGLYRVVARMWRVCGALAAGVALAGNAWSAELPSAERGRLLYDNHCITCHSGKVHRRVTPVPITRSELRVIISAWAKSERLGWTDAEVADVVEFLDSSYYRPLRP